MSVGYLRVHILNTQVLELRRLTSEKVCEILGWNLPSVSASSLGDRDDGLAVVPGLLHGLHTHAEAGLVTQHLGQAGH